MPRRLHAKVLPSDATGVGVLCINPIILEINMYQYEAVVRIRGQIVKTRVHASNAFDAKLLLDRQYGAHNVVGFVHQVH